MYRRSEQMLYAEYSRYYVGTHRARDNYPPRRAHVRLVAGPYPMRYICISIMIWYIHTFVWTVLRSTSHHVTSLATAWGYTGIEMEKKRKGKGETPIRGVGGSEGNGRWKGLDPVAGNLRMTTKDHQKKKKKKKKEAGE